MCEFSEIASLLCTKCNKCGEQVIRDRRETSKWMEEHNCQKSQPSSDAQTAPRACSAPQGEPDSAGTGSKARSAPVGPKPEAWMIVAWQCPQCGHGGLICKCQHTIRSVWSVKLTP